MKYSVLILFTLFISSILHAQDSKITTGVVALQSNDYVKAIESFETGLSKPEMLKEKSIVKGHIYLADAYVNAYRDQLLKNKYPDALLKAYDHLEKGMAQDEENKYKREVENITENLWAMSYNEGVLSYNDNDMTRAKQYFEIARSLKDDYYLTYLMLGYIDYKLNNTDGIIQSMEKAIDLYFIADVETPDNNIISAGIVLASAYNNEKNDPQAAMNVINKLMEIFPESEDLKRMELTIYQNHPELQAESLDKFEEAIQENPDDIGVKLVYAQMLIDQGNIEKALDLYEDVLEKEPDNVYANVNLGSYYINKAAEYNRIASETYDDAAYEKITQLIKENLTLAYPFMVKLTELEPNELEWAQQLVTITSYVDEYNDEMEKWSDRVVEIKRLQGN